MQRTIDCNKLSKLSNQLNLMQPFIRDPFLQQQRHERRANPSYPRICPRMTLSLPWCPRYIRGRIVYWNPWDLQHSSYRHGCRDLEQVSVWIDGSSSRCCTLPTYNWHIPLQKRKAGPILLPSYRIIAVPEWRFLSATEAWWNPNRWSSAHQIVSLRYRMLPSLCDNRTSCPGCRRKRILPRYSYLLDSCTLCSVHRGPEASISYAGTESRDRSLSGRNHSWRSSTSNHIFECPGPVGNPLRIWRL